jgi:purine-binding chemotaxis protein CheW
MTDAVDTTDERKIVTFSIGKQIFGIDMRSLIEIREWEEPTPLPSVPAFIKGVTNLRGTVVPVIGLAERLGWEPSALHARSCILVVNIAGKQAGFLVDEVADIIPIQGGEIQPAPDVEVEESGIISGLVQVPVKTRPGEPPSGSNMVLLLELEALNVTRHLDLAA